MTSARSLVISALVCLVGVVIVLVLIWPTPELRVSVAAVTLGTGVLAAFAMSKSWGGRPSDESEMRPAEARHPVRLPPLPANNALAVPPPLGPHPTPGPRQASALAATDGEPQPSPVLSPGPPSVPPAGSEASVLLTDERALLAQRASVLRGLADLLPRLPDEFAWQAARLLEGAGARRVAPERGATFDPALHRVIETAAAPEVKAHDTVARTLRAGWQDRGQVLVPAHVVVYAVPQQVEGGPGDDRP